MKLIIDIRERDLYDKLTTNTEIFVVALLKLNSLKSV